MEKKYYVCKHCGNIVEKVKDSGVSVVCCGEKMSELVPGTVEASREKHIPDFKVNGNVVEVNVGSIDHPMVPEHYIEWVSIVTKEGEQRKQLLPGNAPNVKFVLSENDELIAVYAYCNLHGLWMAK